MAMADTAILQTGDGELTSKIIKYRRAIAESPPGVLPPHRIHAFGRKVDISCVDWASERRRRARGNNRNILKG
jgi:hypothetical protein